MKHEPCSLLSDSKTTMNLVAADTILTADNQPRSSEPLFKSNWRVFKDGPGLKGKGRALVFCVALPNPLFGKIGHLLRFAARALHNAIAPPELDHELPAMLELREPDDCVPESAWRFHEPNMPESRWNVKYISALARIATL
jgi:hypothetical protein